LSLTGAVIAVVATAEAASERLAIPLRAAGAVVTGTIVNANALSALSAPGFDAAVLDVGDEPERFIALAASLRSDPRTQGMPLFTVAAPGVPCERLVGLGAVHAASGGDRAFLEALDDVVAQRRLSSAAADRVRALEERLKMAHERLAVLRADAQTLTHDARVLCGVVVGFAANLRDGIAGPLDTLQRGHVAQILEAANDTSALVERFGGAARQHTELPAETSQASASARRTARRTLLDLVDLAGAMLRLFEKVAEQKSITLAFDAPEPVTLWGDSMQVKQVVTNLLVNALKFTPPGGRVTVGVRAVPPPGAGAGPSARQQAEIVVRDSGPGIPEAEREHVFERGVRLARDERVPGTGIGLAVVREIVATHGGTVRASEAPGGGAVLCVRLPLDMRSRREPSILLVEEPDAARRIMAALGERRECARELLRGGDGALEGVRAVVVVPRGQRGVFEDLLGFSAAPPPASDAPNRSDP
jgi:signal transduction histidine kinase